MAANYASKLQTLVLDNAKPVLLSNTVHEDAALTQIKTECKLTLASCENMVILR